MSESSTQTNNAQDTSVVSANTNSASLVAVSARDAWYPTHQRDQFILRQLVSKDFKLKYRRSILGVVWSVLNPLLMMTVMAVVFSTFLGNRAEDVVNYPLYLILGNTAFQLMNDATTMGMRSIIDASSLLKKVRINRVVFPVQKVLFAVVNYLFSLIAVGIVMLVFRIPLTIYSFIRDCLLFQKFPATSTILGCLVSAVLALVIGYTVFHKLEKKFILHI